MATYLTDNPADRSLLTQQLVSDFDRAVAAKRQHAAATLADVLRRLAPHDPAVAERLARLACETQDWEHAIDLLETADSPTASGLLLRACINLQMGRFADATIDLASCLSLPDSPPEARLLAALLAAEHGDIESALTLMRQHIPTDDAASIDRHDRQPLLAALITLLIEHDRRSDARVLMQTMIDAQARDHSSLHIPIFVCSLGFPPSELTSELHAAEVERVAAALQANPPLVQLFIEAQQIQPDVEMLHLLRAALETSMPQQQDNADAFASIATVCCLQHDHESAAEWIRRGLACHPMSATLQRMASDSRIRDRSLTVHDATPRLAA